MIIPTLKRQELLDNIFFHFPTHAVVSIIICWIALLFLINDWPASLTQCRLLDFFSFFDLFLLLNLAIFSLFGICFSHLQTTGFVYVVVSKGSQTQCLLSICVCVCASFSSGYDDNDGY